MRASKKEDDADKKGNEEEPSLFFMDARQDEEEGSSPFGVDDSKATIMAGVKEEPSSSFTPAKAAVAVDYKMNDWSPPEAHFPVDQEVHPLLGSIVAMRKVKAYTNGKNLMPTTTYSLIATTTAGKTTNLVNFLVLALQIGSYAAVVVGSFDFEDKTNPFKFPANVSKGVRASQFMSLVYSICVQGGLISALYTFRNGYDEEEMKRSVSYQGNTRLA